MAHWHDMVDEAFLQADSKRSAAEYLSVPATTLNSHLGSNRPDLLVKWRSMPSDGAYRIPRPGTLPKKGNAQRQERMDRLVAEAARMELPDPDAPAVTNTVRLLLAMYRISGTVGWHRGWVRAIMVELRKSSAHVSSAHTIRWYRSRLVADPCGPIVCGGNRADGFADEIEALADRAYA